MKFTLSTAVLSTLAAGQLASAGVHSRHHGKRHHGARHVELASETPAKRDETHLAARDLSSLLSMGFAATGINAVAPNSATPWIGAGGDYTNTFYNLNQQDMILVVWGAAGSWVNKIQPAITVSIPSNSSKVLSFNNGMSGAWAPIYGTTDLVKGNGQILNTWGEYTFANLYSTLDVSREVYMKGVNMSIVTPNCISDMNVCSFQCTDPTADSCWQSYKLVNCDKSQPGQSGANSGWDPQWNAPSGGCSGFNEGAALSTFIGY